MFEKIESITTEEAFFKDYLDLVLSTTPPPLPPKEQKIGVCEARWFHCEDDIAFIETTGGTADDRSLAESIVRDQLAARGIKQAKYSFDRPFYVSTSIDLRRVSTTRTLYHGTLFDHKPSIQALGLVPGVGGFVDEAYGDLDGYFDGPDAEEAREQFREENLQPLTFMTDKRQIDKATTAMRHNISKKLGIGFHDVTENHIRNHGMIVKQPGEMGYSDDPTSDNHLQLPYRPDDGHEGEPWEEKPSFTGWEDEHPYTAEPGDYYTDSTLGSKGLQYLHGPALLRFLKQQGQLPSGRQPHGAYLEKTATWDDVAAKAKRLIQSGNVTLLRNGAENIVASVVGDHGTYQVEISRDDPESRSITQWTCECPWDQYAYQRTRKWKQYEGRPCAHCLATYWKSLSTPVDEEFSPGGGAGQDAQGQQSLFGLPTPNGPPPGGPGAVSPPGIPQGDQLAIPGFDPSGASGSPGAPSIGIPPAPPPAILPGFPGAPPPMPVPVSVPGAKPMSPSNPVQTPGTFSSWKFAKYPSLYHGTNADVSRGLTPHNAPGGMSDDESNPEAIYLTDDPGYAAGFGRVYVVDTNGLDVDLVDARDGGYDYLCLDAIGPERIKSRTAAKGDTFENGDMIRLDKEEYGLAEGRSEEHGAGQYVMIPKNSIGEALGTDRTTGWTHCLFTGPMKNNGPMEPWGVSAWIDGSNLTAMPNVRKPGPAVKRR